MDELPCPPGLLSEEGSEHQNGELVKIKEYFTRKSKRQLTMSDLFCRLNQKADEVAQSYLVPKYVKLHEMKRRKEPYPQAYLDCLKNPDDAFQPLGKINDEVFDDLDQPTDSEIDEEGFTLF